MKRSMDTKEMTRQAIALLKSKRLNEAMELYHRICRADEGNAEAWMMLGAINGELGNLDKAIPCIHRATTLQPDYAQAHYNLGNLLRMQGRYQEALSSFERAVEINPDYAAAWLMLGNVNQSLGRLNQAESSYRRAASHQPDSVEVNMHLGEVLFKSGNYKEATACYKKVTGIAPGNAKAWYSLGNVQNQSRKISDAISSYQKAIHLDSSFSAAYKRLGETLSQQDRPQEAVTAFNELGGVLAQKDQPKEAIVSYKKALDIEPDNAIVLSNLGNAYQYHGDLDEAEDSLLKALRLNPDSPEANNNMGNILKSQGRILEAEASYRRAAKLRPGFQEIQSNLLLCLNYIPGYSPAELLKEHMNWAQLYTLSIDVNHLCTDKPDSDRRLRIGYVSPDLRTHAAVSFIIPILENHDASGFEIFCYAEVSHPDDVTEHLRTLVHGWQYTCGMSDSKMADAIRSDKIDILVDLAGHTRKSRLAAFFTKPAPIQVTYLGYPNTTGLPSIDYRLTDEVTDPVGDEKFYSEKLYYLKNGFSCYAPPEGVPEVSPLPAIKTKTITFGSFNNLFKINDMVVDLWCRVLHANPFSRLIIFRHVIKGKVRDRLYKKFTDRGINIQRVELWNEIPAKYKKLPRGKWHLGLYEHIDIVLDTFPWNGHTISCEALWMGVPVVTLYGDRHAGRICASALNAIGLSKLIASTPDEYLKIATDLANNTDKLEKMRMSLRNQMRDSALCDGKRFTEILEEAYREMWKRWRSSQT